MHGCAHSYSFFRPSVIFHLSHKTPTFYLFFNEYLVLPSLVCNLWTIFFLINTKYSYTYSLVYDEHVPWFYTNFNQS